MYQPFKKEATETKLQRVGSGAQVHAVRQCACWFVGCSFPFVCLTPNVQV
jgi:hypothetical protein